METTHARFAPSGAHRWARCAGSMVLEADYPDQSSGYAKEGTWAHLIASLCLIDGTNARDHIGKSFDVEGQVFELTQTHAEHIDEFIELARAEAEGGILLVDKKVDFSPYIRQPDSKGTMDVGAIFPAKAKLIDFKYGMGVKVDAFDNWQLGSYGLGLVNDYGHLADFEEVELIISQPRLGHVSRWTVPLKELEAFGDALAIAADKVLDAFEFEGIDGWAEKYLNPSESACKFCRAKATCPALLNAVEPYVSTSATADEFNAFLSEAEDDVVASLMGKAEMAEMLIKAVRAEVERRLLKGEPVPGYKLVEGRKGNRAWSDEAKAEELMKKKFRFKDADMFDMKLVSPTTAEKRFKGQVTRWKQLEGLITRSDGKPSVAPDSDPRPAITMQATAEEFAGMIEKGEAV